MKEMLKKIRQRGQEMKGEPVLKAEFPAGSSDSVPASAAGREAMPGPVPGDEVAGKASPFDWLNKVLKPLEPPAGASAGRTFQAPLLVPAHKPSSHRRGPPRGKNKPRGEKKSLESNDIWKQIVEELHKGNDWDPEMDYLEVLAHNHFKSLEDAEAKPAGEGDAASQPMSRTELLGSMTEPLGDGEVMDQKAGQKEVFPQGSRGQLAAPAAVRKAKTDTGTGTGTGGAASPTTRVPDSQKGLGRGFCKGTHCLLELMAIVAGGELVFMLCCFGIWYSWKRKRQHLEEKLKAGGWSQDLYSRKSNSSTSESDQFTVVPQSSVVL
ncbi:uncharacterized protein LOC118691648 isoform X4 [Molothrus ater]|uniref:uncharacterized protein LOC118691648 isoform X4 n=1 Tax=Molothrus ater TaxID=84834 RepID=UPI0017495652|nr:uncharacterized protein LOC118691648 isoform X4 [Molothrus ater]